MKTHSFSYSSATVNMIFKCYSFFFYHLALITWRNALENVMYVYCKKMNDVISINRKNALHCV